MKNAIILIALLLSCIVKSQSIDSFLTRRVDSLYAILNKTDNKNQLDSLWSAFVEIEKLIQEIPAKHSVEYGQCCFGRGKILYFKGNFAEAETWFLEALAIYDKVLTEEDPKYILCMHYLAVNYWAKGEYTKSESLNIKVRSIREKLYGKKNLDYVNSTTNLAIVYSDIGKYDLAEILLIESKAILEKITTPTNKDYLSLLGSLANLYQKMSNYDKAEATYLSLLNLREQVYGKLSEQYSAVLNNLGVLYLRMGEYYKCEKMLLQVREIRETVLGKYHPNYAASLHNLANYFLTIGDYKKSEEYYLEAKSIREKVLGKKHPDYSKNINNLAVLYQKMGNNQKAESLLIEAKNIKLELVGNQNPLYATTLKNLGSLYMNEGNFAKAETYYNEVMQIFEKINGGLNTEYGALLRLSANLQLYKGNYAIAELLLNKSLKILGEILGIKHPEYATVLFDLAELYYIQNKCVDADTMYRKSKQIYDEAFGKNHPDYGKCLNGLAKLNWKINNLVAASNFYKEFTLLEKNLINNASKHLSEPELFNYIEKFRQNRSYEYSLLEKIHEIDPEFARSCFNNLLFYKGYLLEAAMQLRNLALKDSLSKVKYATMIAIHKQLSEEYSKAIKDRRDLIDLEKKSLEAEKELRISIKNTDALFRQATWEDIRNKLHDDEVALEFIHYNYYTPLRSDSIWYSVMIIRKGCKYPEFVTLFEERQLSSMLESVPKFDLKNYCNSIYSMTIIDKINTPSLNALIWLPLQSHLKNVNTIYYSPTGLMNRLNLGAIAINEKEVISDKYKIFQVTSTRNLVYNELQTNPMVESREKLNLENSKAILYGGIEYDIDSTLFLAENANFSNDLFSSRNLTRSISNQMDFNYPDSVSRGSSWYYLKWTEKEINSVESILKEKKVMTEVNKSYSATEENFKSIGVRHASPRILHIATHGYFFPDPKKTVRTQITGQVGSQMNVSSEDPVFKMSEHPMIRSGLILAIGNYAWKTGKPFKEGMEDGILTAFEISQMDLSNTELVVLSACETGLGDIKGNEGVYGLQRAFKIAGVKYIIMSLWQVPDKQTSQLMIAFYKNWLNRKMTIPDAFYAAQKELRNQGLDPFQWAGFILVE